MFQATFLRDARWLTADRVRAYGLMIATGFAAMALWIIASEVFVYHTPGVLGGDFLSFYAASKLALSGHAAEAWHRAAHLKVEHSLAPTQGYLAFFYPPPYLLLCWPLALLPYGVALTLWILATAGAALAAMRRLLTAFAPDVRVALPVLLAFPALWINAGSGQNGALSLTILAAGAVWLDRRPALAGAILGLLVVKPQLALVLPFALAGAALVRPALWRAFVMAGVSAAAFCALAWLVLGNAGYAAFFGASQAARETLMRGLVDPAEMQSLFAALKVLHAPLGLAIAAQAILSVAVIATAACAAWRYRPDGFGLMALIAAATVLATPFILDYDLLIIALPLAWLGLSGARDGARRWERSILLAAFVLPLVSRGLAKGLGVPLAPLVLCLLFAAVVARLRARTVTAGAV